MAVDTALKRKSAINFSLPGAYLMPIPDGTIDSVNRRQMTDSYAISPQTLLRSFWVQDQSSSSDWKQDSDSSQTWVQDQNSNGASDFWVPEREIEEY